MVGGMSLLNEHIDGCVAAVESLREHGAAFEAGCDVMVSASALFDGKDLKAAADAIHLAASVG